MNGTTPWLSAVCLCLALTACSKENPEIPSIDREIDLSIFENGFVIATTTPVLGDFLSIQGSSTVNSGIQSLLTGYGTYEQSPQGDYVLNQVAIANLQIEESTTGDKRYVFQIQENLKWNNGEAITAKDYLFSVMVYASPEFAKLQLKDVGSNQVNTAKIQGYQDFVSGNPFSGLEILGDYQFALTVPAEELPYHYETALLTIEPLPMAVLAPNVDILDTGEGLMFSENFSTELLAETIPSYATAPTVTCGAYSFVSYEPNNMECTLKANPYFLGRVLDRATASMSTLIVKTIPYAEQSQALTQGTVHLLLDSTIDLPESMAYPYYSSPSTTMTALEFACEFGATAHSEVREAVAYCLYDWALSAPSTEQATAALENHSDSSENAIDLYSYGIEEAEAVLKQGGWIYHQDGTDYVDGSLKQRYKVVKGELVPLVIQWAVWEDCPYWEEVAEHLLDSALEVGIHINTNELSYQQLLTHMYRKEIGSAQYHMFLFTRDYGDISPVYYQLSANSLANSPYYSQGIQDEILEDLREEMTSIDSGNHEAWEALFLEFQLRYEELFVSLPLYTTTSHYNWLLSAYTPHDTWTWDQAILRATLG